MNYYLEQQRKRWNEPDWDFIGKMALLIIGIIVLIFYIGKTSVRVYAKVLEVNARYQESKIVNNELERLYKTGEAIGEKLVAQQWLDERKRIYNDLELETQKSVIINAQKEIAKKNCPIGTYIYLEDKLTVVRVNGYYGYQANTYEGINFMTTEDKWHTLSRHEYQLLGGKY